MKTKQGSYIVECENKEQTISVVSYFKKNNNEKYAHWKYVSYDFGEYNYNNDLALIKIFNKKHELISFSDWENLPNHETEKELIGWKLEKEEYSEVAGLIVYKVYGNKIFLNYESGCHFKKGSPAEERLKEAGVLELWFTPVYKEEEQKTLKLSFGELTQDDIEQLKQALK